MKQEEKKPIVKFKKLDQEATIPTYAHEGDSGMDLHSLVCVTFEYFGERLVIDTGLSVEIPPGYEGQVRSRSGLASKMGIVVLNSPGTIDSTYRGSIKVILARLGDGTGNIGPIELAAGCRIAQLVIAPVAQAEIVEVQELTETERGAGGLGSTGK